MVEQVKAYGYTGKILRVNLSEEKISVEKPGELFYRQYLGGRNIAAHYLLKELKPGIDPLSEKNILVFATSILTGSALPGTSRFTIAAKSPLTLGYGESEAGGFWGPELKFAGYDAIIIEGKAQKPVYLMIQDDEVSLKDARNLWGMDTGNTQDAICAQEDDDRIRIACIGPAGEKMVRFACIMNDYDHAAGRTGLGAVMGSKNLKAIAVRGTRKLALKSPQEMLWFSKSFYEKFKVNSLALNLHNLGTPKNVIPLDTMGLLPTKNFRGGSFEHAADISGEKMKETITVGMTACYACPVKCNPAVAVKTPYKVDPRYGGPEYETIGAIGTGCMVSDMKAIAKANELCNKYGMDTISTGLTIAFAMECYENGIIAREDTGGLDLKFGNADAMLKIVEDIACRRGLGAMLAEGSMRAAKKLGPQTEKFAMHVKGQELPSHEPRGKWGVALGYAVSPTGADHLQAAHDVCFIKEGDYIDYLAPVGKFGPVEAQSLGIKKVELFTSLQKMWSLYNVLDMCIFVGYPEFPGLFSLTDLPLIIESATGWKMSVPELMEIGEKGVNLLRLFNVREGFSRNDDKLPERLHQPLESGHLKGAFIPKEDFNQALTFYYEMMGWDTKTGAPTAAKIKELGLEDIAG